MEMLEQKMDKEEKATRDTYTYDEAVELTGHGRYNYLLLTACSLITNACSLDMFGYATVVAAASCDLQLDLTLLGILASAPFAGVLFAFPWGYYADTRGRKRAMVVSTSVGFTFAVASSFSTHWMMMLVTKVIGSCFSTASFTLTMALLGESTGHKHRSQFLFIMNSFNLASEVFSFALAWLILPIDFKLPIPWLDMTFRPWRLYTIALALPLGIGAVFMFWLYESPKYLASQGDYATALEVLRKIYERNGGNGADYPVKNLIPPPTEFESTPKQSFWKTLKKQTVPIFRPPLLWRTLQLFFLMALCCSTNNVFIMWYPTIVNFFFKSFNAEVITDLTFCQRVFGEANISPETHTFQCNDTISPNTLYSGMVYGLFFAAVSLAAVKVASRPKLLLIVVLLISGVSQLLVNLRDPIANMIFFTLLQATPLGIGCISSYFVDLYPTMHRGLVTSLGMMVARLCSLIGVSIIGPIITQHCEATFYSWALFVFNKYLFNSVAYLFLSIILVVPGLRLRTQGLLTGLTDLAEFKLLHRDYPLTSVTQRLHFIVRPVASCQDI